MYNMISEVEGSRKAYSLNGFSKMILTKYRYFFYHVISQGNSINDRVYNYFAPSLGVNLLFKL